MRSWLVVVVLWICGGRGSGVNDMERDDISKYWAGDIKALAHLYGKTSDRELYGASLPPPIVFDGQSAKIKENASNKAERADAIGPVQIGRTEKGYGQITNPPRSALNNHRTNKPLNGETLNYLKYLEVLKDRQSQHASAEGFKPHSGGGGKGDYASVKELFARDTNETGTIGELVAGDGGVYGMNRAKSKVRLPKGNQMGGNSDCYGAVCRNKPKTSKGLLKRRVHYRPVNKVKRIVYDYYNY